MHYTLYTALTFIPEAFLLKRNINCFACACLLQFTASNFAVGKADYYPKKPWLQAVAFHSSLHSTFHCQYIRTWLDKSGNSTAKYPFLKQIIMRQVHAWMGQHCKLNVSSISIIKKQLLNCFETVQLALMFLIVF